MDEFGHIGPYLGRHDPKHNDHPVFGLGGFVLPFYSVRGFGELRFKADSVQQRPLGFRSDTSEFTIVFWATEKGDKFVPSNAINIALARKAAEDIEQTKQQSRDNTAQEDDAGLKRIMIHLAMNIRSLRKSADGRLRVRGYRGDEELKMGTLNITQSPEMKELDESAGEIVKEAMKEKGQED